MGFYLDEATWLTDSGVWYCYCGHLNGAHLLYTEDCSECACLGFEARGGPRRCYVPVHEVRLEKLIALPYTEEPAVVLDQVYTRRCIRMVGHLGSHR